MATHPKIKADLEAIQVVPSSEAVRTQSKTDIKKEADAVTKMIKIGNEMDADLKNQQALLQKTLIELTTIQGKLAQGQFIKPSEIKELYTKYQAGIETSIAVLQSKNADLKLGMTSGAKLDKSVQASENTTQEPTPAKKSR